MLQKPYINTRLHIAPMMDNYDVFAAQYNDTINQQRKDDPTNQANYQTLKPTHRALFNNLVLELGKKMFQNIRNYEKINSEQGNKGTFSLLSNSICGDGVFVCSTNRYQLSKYNAKELSTVYRNILRLMEAGVITKKVGHGKKANFELHINADFLIVSDKANADYNPLNSSKTAPTKDFPLCDENAECKEEKNVQEHLINKIYSAGADFNSIGSESTINNAAPLDLKSIVKSFESKTGTLTGTEGMPTLEANNSGKTAQMKPTGGAWDVQNMMNDREIDFVKVFSKKEPKQWHGFHRLSYAAYFVDYTIQAIYSKRGVEIYPLARIAAIEYAEKFYFPDPFGQVVKTPFKPCETVENYAARLNQLMWCVDAANRYAAKNSAYFVLISKYIDLENEKGLKGTFNWYLNAKQNEADKAKALKNIKEMKMLHAKTRELAEGKTTLMEAENYIENHLPKYKFVFRHSLVTIINQLEKEK